MFPYWVDILSDQNSVRQSGDLTVAIYLLSFFLALSGLIPAAQHGAFPLLLISF